MIRSTRLWKSASVVQEEDHSSGFCVNWNVRFGDVEWRHIPRIKTTCKQTQHEAWSRISHKNEDSVIRFPAWSKNDIWNIWKIFLVCTFIFWKLKRLPSFIEKKSNLLKLAFSELFLLNYFSFILSLIFFFLFLFRWIFILFFLKCFEMQLLGATKKSLLFAQFIRACYSKEEKK